ncbi:MAG TPA: general stress protein [Mycobacterium sp.]|nr:general stress protein [Mycobacterium sp.]
MIAWPGSPGPQVATAPRPRREVVASFHHYLDAQRLVDRMSDGGFPVEHVRIVGDGVRTVENITGRLTTGKAALAGAGSGAWFGLLIGLLFAVFTVGPLWIYAMLIAAIIGAFWGAAFGCIAHWSTRGQRDFSSVFALEAQRYDICVAAGYAADAARFVDGPPAAGAA